MLRESFDGPEMGWDGIRRGQVKLLSPRYQQSAADEKRMKPECDRHRLYSRDTTQDAANCCRVEAYHCSVGEGTRLPSMLSRCHFVNRPNPS